MVCFFNCSGFTSNLILPNSVIAIGHNTFNNCFGFNGVLTLPNSIESINNYAFYNCSGFSGDLIIPYSAILIGNSAFEKCSGFNGNLVIQSNETIQILEHSFYNTNFQLVIYKKTTEPNCSSDSFPPNQKLSLSSDYKDPEFCGVILIYPTETLNPSQTEIKTQTIYTTFDPTNSPKIEGNSSKKLSKILLIGIICGCCAFIIIAIVIIIVVIKKKRKRNPNLQYSDNLISDFSSYNK